MESINGASVEMLPTVAKKQKKKSPTKEPVDKKTVLLRKTIASKNAKIRTLNSKLKALNKKASDKMNKPQKKPRATRNPTCDEAIGDQTTSYRDLILIPICCLQHIKPILAKHELKGSIVNAIFRPVEASSIWIHELKAQSIPYSCSKNSNEEAVFELVKVFLEKYGNNISKLEMEYTRTGYGALRMFKNVLNFYSILVDWLTLMPNVQAIEIFEVECDDAIPKWNDDPASKGARNSKKALKAMQEYWRERDLKEKKRESRNYWKYQWDDKTLTNLLKSKQFPKLKHLKIFRIICSGLPVQIVKKALMENNHIIGLKLYPIAYTFDRRRKFAIDGVKLAGVSLPCLQTLHIHTNQIEDIQILRKLIKSASILQNLEWSYFPSAYDIPYRNIYGLRPDSKTVTYKFFETFKATLVSIKINDRIFGVESIDCFPEMPKLRLFKSQFYNLDKELE